MCKYFALIESYQLYFLDSNEQIYCVLLVSFFQRNYFELPHNLYYQFAKWHFAVDATIFDTRKTQQVRLTNFCEDDSVKYLAMSKTCLKNFNFIWQYKCT